MLGILLQILINGNLFVVSVFCSTQCCITIDRGPIDFPITKNCRIFSLLKSLLLLAVTATEEVCYYDYNEPT